MILKSDFKPAWWLANAHLQTAWGTIARRRANIPLRRERIELPDGDFVDLDWAEPIHPAKEQTPLIIVLHGLGGSIDSHYARAILKAVCDQHWRAVFMHFRGASGMPNRAVRSYHSGETQDIQFVANLLKQREPQTRFFGVGYSLGGNVLLKWLGETRTENPLSGAVAVSVPFVLSNAAKRLNAGLSRIYQWFLLRHLRSVFITKYKMVKLPIDLQQLMRVKNFWEFDTHVTAPLHGFKDAADYYQQSSSRPYLKSITKPTLILHAKDDPFMTPACIPIISELAATVTLELSEAGGHVGFIAGNTLGKPEYWAEKRIINYFNELLTGESVVLLDNQLPLLD